MFKVISMRMGPMGNSKSRGVRRMKKEGKEAFESTQEILDVLKQRFVEKNGWFIPTLYLRTKV
jgi:hypothetical protein